mgnify:CR=1 FL=1
MSTFKLITPVAILLVVFGGGIWFASAGLSDKPAPPVPPIARIQEMSDLATQRVHLSDSIIGENDHWKVRWMLHGEAVLGVDLSQARYASIDEKNRTATLALPPAHLISSKVDHHRSAEISATQKTWIPSPGLKSLRDDVWRNADEKVARLAVHDGYLEATNLQAERVLGKLFRDMGWNVSCEWTPHVSGDAD